jgi:hypothetical protein
MEKWALLFRDFGLSAQMRELRQLNKLSIPERVMAWALVTLVQSKKAALCWWLVIHATSANK